MANRTTGGVGTNQYQTKGHSKVRMSLPLLDINAMNSQTYAAIAQDQACSPEMLRYLAEHQSGWVRAAVAGNINTPPGALARLGQDSSDAVRYAVASNPNTPVEVIATLAQSQNVNIDSALLLNVRCPEDALTRMAQEDIFRRDLGTSMIERVLAHPNCPASILTEAFKDRWIRNRPMLVATLLSNPNCPVDILTKAIRSSDKNVRQAAIANPNTPEHVRVIAALGT